MIRLYLITLPSGDPAESVGAALSVLPRGSAGVQLRQPAIPARELLEVYRAIAGGLITPDVHESARSTTRRGWTIWIFSRHAFTWAAKTSMAGDWNIVA